MKWLQHIWENISFSCIRWPALYHKILTDMKNQIGNNNYIAATAMVNLQALIYKWTYSTVSVVIFFLS